MVLTEAEDVLIFASRPRSGLPCSARLMARFDDSVPDPFGALPLTAATWFFMPAAVKDDKPTREKFKRGIYGSSLWRLLGSVRSGKCQIFS